MMIQCDLCKWTLVNVETWMSPTWMSPTGRVRHYQYYEYYQLCAFCYYCYGRNILIKETIDER